MSTSAMVTKLCRGCGRDLPIEAFPVDRSRADGRTYRCRECRNASARARHMPKSPGGRLGVNSVPARDGDVRQARRRINYLVEQGRLMHPNKLPCTDCGHRWANGERRHEYDHHLGYAAAHHEDVEVVCTTCHHAREDARHG